MPSRFITFLVLTGVVLFSSPLLARDTFYDLPVNDAVKSPLGKERLLNVPFYMAKQKHPAIKKDLGVFRSNKRTNAVNKTDEEACKVAFLSAIISLQERAQRMGADGVVDIKSITKHKSLISAGNYRCSAGDIMANVAITGRVVEFYK